ncbi:MAG: hypothetical protein Q7R49_02340 [Candidatus Daviesbacteria bacterium]|nr:hypothetical protein [Candidatus Daviesbacteria bacterium]
MSSVNKKFLFLIIFSLVGFLSLQIPFTKLAGSNISFTLFDFFGPISAAFLGPLYGVISVFAVEIVNVFIKHTSLNTPAAIIRLFPALFATLYFGFLSQKKSQSKWVLLVPIICIISFVANPVGRQVWYYSLFWTIPVLAYFKKENLLFRSLGATFTAHAVGGATWIWALNLPVNTWNSLIPVVITERLLFATGIAISYLAVKHILDFLISRKILPAYVSKSPTN